MQGTDLLNYWQLLRNILAGIVAQTFHYNWTVSLMITKFTSRCAIVTTYSGHSCTSILRNFRSLFCLDPEQDRLRFINPPALVHFRSAHEETINSISLCQSRIKTIWKTRKYNQYADLDNTQSLWYSRLECISKSVNCSICQYVYIFYSLHSYPQQFPLFWSSSKNICQFQSRLHRLRNNFVPLLFLPSKKLKDHSQYQRQLLWLHSKLYIKLPLGKWIL